MNELKPLLSSDATDFERQLLAATSGERPSPELQFRMEQALGFAPVALPGADASGGGAEAHAIRPEISGTHLAVKAGTNPSLGSVVSKAAVSKAVLPKATLFKAALVIGVGAGLLAGGLALRSSEPTTPLVSPAPLALPVAPAPPVEVAAPTREDVTTPSAPSTEMSRELREEIDRLDQVREAPAQGDARAAAALLDSYSARFPEGHLAREARALRTRTAQLARGTTH